MNYILIFKDTPYSELTKNCKSFIFGGCSKFFLYFFKSTTETEGHNH